MTFPLTYGYECPFLVGLRRTDSLFTSLFYFCKLVATNQNHTGDIILEALRFSNSFMANAFKKCKLRSRLH